MNVIKGIEKTGVAILHGIEEPFKLIARVERVLETAITNEPELKGAITVLVAKCERIGADVMRDVGERGLNLPDDVETARAIADLGNFLKTSFIPLVERLYGAIKADVIEAGNVIHVQAVPGAIVTPIGPEKV